VGVCGLDCGLCPRTHTAGGSRCPGCCGPGFWEKHPSCGVITCCVRKRNHETCADCDEFPCARFRDAGRVDSFVTYRNVLSTLRFIRARGLAAYVEKQKPRLEILEKMLAGYDDGRSKSFYCLAAALLPLEGLAACLKEASSAPPPGEGENRKLLAKALTRRLHDLAAAEKVDLRLRVSGKGPGGGHDNEDRN
jgi:hypothetical protein